MRMRTNWDVPPGLGAVACRRAAPVLETALLNCLLSAGLGRPPCFFL